MPLAAVEFLCRKHNYLTITTTMDITVIEAASVVAALSAGRMYVAGIGGYSAWCLLGGVAAYEATNIYASLPTALTSVLAKIPGLANPVEQVVAIASAISYELAVTQSLSVSDVTTLAGLQRMLVGGVLGVVGYKVGAYLAGKAGYASTLSPA